MCWSLIVKCPALGRVVFEADQARLELAIESVASEKWFVAFTVRGARSVKVLDKVARVVLIVQSDQSRLMLRLVINDLHHPNVRVFGGHG